MKRGGLASAPFTYIDGLRLLVIDGLVAERLVVLQRTDAVAARVGRDGDQRLRDVVVVVRLREVVAEARGGVLGQRAVALLVRGVRRVGRDADQVVARRHDRLAVAAVEDEVLAAEEEAVGVGPTVADALVAGDADGAAVGEL